MTLNAQTRDRSHNLHTLRTQGLLPAVVYGAKMNSTSISINHADFIKLYKVAGETTVIDIVVDGATIPALIGDIQMNAATHKALHVDFLAIDAKTAVTVPVPVRIVGESPAVASGLGLLNTIIDEIEIEVLPTEIPHFIEVDISGLVGVHDSFRISDLKLSGFAQAILEPETVICVVSEFQTETEGEERTLDSIEVAKKGKKEVEEE
jgi:large subunit ribosomal protein L25